jgi:hypothetical protein
MRTSLFLLAVPDKNCPLTHTSPDDLKGPQNEFSWARDQKHPSPTLVYTNTWKWVETIIAGCWSKDFERFLTFSWTSANLGITIRRVCTDRGSSRTINRITEETLAGLLKQHKYIVRSPVHRTLDTSELQPAVKLSSFTRENVSCREQANNTSWQQYTTQGLLWQEPLTLRFPTSFHSQTPTRLQETLPGYNNT